MTREDANFILANIDRRVCDDELSEALDMAIEALEQEPCEDAINRKDLEECIELMTDIKGDTVYAVRWSDIRQFPPVTPKPKMGHWIKKKKHHKDDFQEFDYLDVRCSECGARKHIGWTNVRHCPMCGAKMEK